jgi:hypothetical protein
MNGKIPKIGKWFGPGPPREYFSSLTKQVRQFGSRYFNHERIDSDFCGDVLSLWSW